jgi:serine/threonine protein kinase
MTPERYRRIRELFEAALERDPDSRIAWLEIACGGDEQLRDEVQRMLIADSLSGAFISSNPTRVGTVQGADSLNLEGRRIGPYNLLWEIGRGGMGSVYLAERADSAFRKLVALKLVNPEVTHSELIRRFQQERQVLAKLEHPNIARLLDGGATDEGWPYLVMEYVEGQPIDQYCDERKLNVAERIKLFQEVCAAVQYAHQSLIVHRDLKPSNILVTENGTVKLLDFGIAKLLRTEGQEPAHLTQTGIHLMTPEYASPEQAKGQTITTATDVYSLGVILYELLTGHRPYRMKSRLLHEVVRIICEEEPTRPSTVISVVEEVDTEGKMPSTITPDGVSQVREGKPGRLKRRLTGDLDTILLMTLRKEPQRRYSSVEQFSEDLERHLTGLPLIARRGAVPYRVSKFLRRKRRLLATATLVILTAISYFFIDQYRKAHQQRLTAQDLFYSMKSLDVDIANLERFAIRLDIQKLQPQEFQDFTKQIAKLRGRRGEVEKSYDHLLDTLRVYHSHSEQERLVLRVTRMFGECELTVPPAFMTEVQNHVRYWQSSGKFARAIRNVRAKGYIPKIVEELLAQNLPPQLLYIALQESEFDEYVSSLPTRNGIAKGMWQFTPETAVSYGLRIGPLAMSRRPDPADERHQWDKATHAAALYLKDLYSKYAQSSALLTIAYFNAGDIALQPLFHSAVENPRERNFWRVVLAHRHAIKTESYQYVLRIVSAAVIGENPRLFGFNFDNPLHCCLTRVQPLPEPTSAPQPESGSNGGPFRLLPLFQN